MEENANPNVNPFDGLTQKQIDAIEALTSTKGYIEAAEKAGVTRQTLRVWLREPAFRRALRASQKEMFEALTLSLLSLADEATTAFEDVLKNPSNPGSAVKRAAANDVIAHATKLRELVDHETRLDELEQRLTDREPASIPALPKKAA